MSTVTWPTWSENQHAQDGRSNHCVYSYLKPLSLKPKVKPNNLASFELYEKWNLLQRGSESPTCTSSKQFGRENPTKASDPLAYLPSR